MQALLAALPILIILPLMLGLRWSAARAGVVGASIAVGLAVAGFGFGRAVYPGLGPARAVGGAAVEAGFTAATILWIVFPALCIYQLQQRTRAIDVLRHAIGSVSADPRVLIILVAWFFALFLEGAAGFGTPVALAAPFLVSAGVERVQAVSMAMIGHAAGVSFGAVGTPVLAQVTVTGLAGPDIARATAIYHLLLAWVMLFFLARLLRSALAPAGHHVAAGTEPLPWYWLAVAGACFLAPFALLAYTVGPELPTLAGALAGGLLFVFLLRRWGPRPAVAAAVAAEKDAPVALPDLLRAASPYLALVALILLTRLVEPVRGALDGYRWEWRLWETFTGRISPLYHPGTMLMAGFFAGAMVQRVRWPDVAAAMGAALRQLGPATVALVAMLLLSRVLVHAGMINAIAAAAATTLGGAWPLFAPLTGVLGTFVTGSATTSNILFTEFQVTTARELGLPVLVMIGAQGFGAAVGNIICPHNIIAGGATVGIAGREGEVLRATLVPCLIYALLGGVVALVLAARVGAAP
jgi:lactate permease